MNKGVSSVKSLAGFLVISTLLAVGARAADVPAFSKVMVVFLENTDFKDAIAQPFMSQLASDGAVLTNFIAEKHPSQSNYIAMISGDTFSVPGDGNVSLDGRHVGNLVEEAGKSWKVYAEGYPGSCFQGARQGAYVRKHEPFISFKNVQSDPTRCARIVEASALDTDIAAGQLPDFSLYIPDLNDDGHDTGVRFADKWLTKRFGPLLKDPRFMQNMLLIVTFDESHTPSPNLVYTALFGAHVKPGSQSATRLDHYSLLRTIELGLGLQDLGKLDLKAVPVTGIWQ